MVCLDARRRRSWRSPAARTFAASCGGFAPDGRAERVLEGLRLTQRPQVEYIALTRFDVHPDGSRIVLEGYEFFEADISMIENVP